MIKFARDFRLIPIVILATICLFVLKVTGLVFDGGYTLADRMRARANPNGLTVTTRDSIPDYPRIVVAEQPKLPDLPAATEPQGQWAPAMFNFGGMRHPPKEGDVTGSVDSDKTATLPKIDGRGAGNMAGKAGGSAVDKNADNNIVTGSSGGEGGPQHAAAQAPAEPLKTSEKPPAGTKLEVGNEPVPLTPGKINSPGERAILNRLQDRRETLDNRDKQLDMRESLIKAAEKRLEAKVGELKDIESRIKTETGARDKEEQARLKGLVTMYENMKPKDAARIFDRLDLKILVDISTAMKPVAMSAVLAQMSPDAAERLTVELATRANAQQGQEADNLPKIEGSPSKN